MKKLTFFLVFSQKRSTSLENKFVENIFVYSKVENTALSEKLTMVIKIILNRYFIFNFIKPLA